MKLVAYCGLSRGRFFGDAKQNTKRLGLAEAIKNRSGVTRRRAISPKQVKSFGLPMRVFGAIVPLPKAA